MKGREMYALVIDDEAQVRRFVSSALREDGRDVHEAESAEQAFGMQRNFDWSVVFCASGGAV
jgi:CheY-like chemotaxis protein